MTDLEKWEANGREFEWDMPCASLWKRLPIIRHVRAMWIAFQIERHYSVGIGSIGIRSGYDDWVLYGIWHGMERPL